MTESIRLAREGGTDALTTLVDTHCGDLYRLADRILLSDADSEAVVRETFLQAVMGDEAPASLDALCEEIALSWTKEQRWDSKPAGVAGLVKTYAGPATEAIEARAICAVERLSLDLRLPILHRYQLGLDEVESLRRLGISDRTFRMRIRSALSSLVDAVPEWTDSFETSLGEALRNADVPVGLASEIPDGILMRRASPGVGLAIATVVGAIALFVAAVMIFLPA